MMYSWGEANGSDAEKIKLCVCPQNGTLTAKHTEKMKITVVPIKEGIVQFLCIPCYVDDTRKIIILGIECSIEPFYVTFHLPRSDPEIFGWKTSFSRVEWRVDSLETALDIAGESKKGMRLLDRYKMREERELMNTDLDQGDVLKDASVGVSGAAESGAESSPSTRTSGIIKTNNKLLKEERNYEEEDSSRVVQFSRTTLPPPKQPVVIEFLNLPLRKVERKTFIIKNETAIPSNFWISIKNFYPVRCSCEKLIEDRIKFMFKQAFGGVKNIIEESLCQVKQPGVGVVIYVDPLNSDLDPFKAVPVDIYVFADTWGTYTDELEIRVTGLPRYTLAICVEVVGSPISLSIEQKDSTKIPVLNYGTEAAGSRLTSRKVLLKNTSVLPIAINWHVFLVEPTTTERIPFNVAYDVCTPFTDELSKELKNNRSQRKRESQMREPVTFEQSSKMSRADDSMANNNSLGNLLGSLSDVFQRKTTSCMRELQKPSTDSTWAARDEVQKMLRHSKYNEEYTEDNAYKPTETDEDETEKKEDIEFRISILPCYGESNNKVCTVAPREIFMLPKHSDTIVISVYPDKCVSNGHFRGEFACKVLGLLRIAPSDKYQDNQYSRTDGLYLLPIEFDVKAIIIKPQLLFNISKADRTFTCCINDVIKTKRKKLELKKTFFFCNSNSNVLNVLLETYDPFHIKFTSIYIETNPCKPIVGICINGHGCAEVI
nr:uncharacterized protein LOC116430493 isoform X1 [Nomia melanderi]